MIQRYHAYGTYAGDDGPFVDYNDHLAALAAKDAEIASLERECAVRNERELGYLSRAQNAEAEAAGLRADAERWRAVSAMMTHEHRADAVGWTLGALLPGDDPDAAIDAARGEHDSDNDNEDGCRVCAEARRETAQTPWRILGRA